MREIMDLNRKWAFVMGAENVPDAAPTPAYYVNLPHTWNAIDGQDGGNDYYRGVCYYVKSVAREELLQGEKLFLEIGAANASADVYVNGRFLAHHDGGYAAFRVDVTDALKAENTFVIAVDNRANESVYPQIADFTFYGGLYRGVRLIAVPSAHFDLMHFGGPGIAVTSEICGRDARVTTDVYLTGAQPTHRLRYAIQNAQGETLCTQTVPAHSTSVQMTIGDVIRWHGRKNPYLYTAQVELIEGETVLDCVRTRFGCRTFAIDAQRGFFLNGEAYPLRGVSRHQDRWGVGNALEKAHHEEDIDLICELGATTVRLAHYQHDDIVYDLCDERGLIVWAEIPYISQHVTAGRANTLTQMKELIIQNYNHPSIAVWGLSNEITMKGAPDAELLEHHRTLNALCHEMDKTRLTTMAVVSMCGIDEAYVHIPDTVSYNHYFGWYGGNVSMYGPWLDRFHEAYPNKPIGVSEYGAEALNWHTSAPEQGDYTEEYQAHYHEEAIKQLFSRPYLWATHVWNMFDFGADARCEGGENGQNHKGLVTFDRKYKKDAFYAYKAWLSDDPFVHICGKRYVDRAEAVTRVTVYSNQPEVELFVNGRSLGKQTSDVHFFYFDVPNEGESVLTAQAGACRDESRIRRVETFNEAYRLKEKGAVLNWFDVQAPEGFYSLNDKLGDILKSPAGAQVLGGMMKDMMRGEDGAAGPEMTPEMMQMMNGFTVLRLTNLLGMTGASMSKEALLALNARLNAIEKVK